MPRKTGIKIFKGTGKLVALDILSLLIPSKTRGIKKAKEDGIRLISCIYLRSFFFSMSWNILLPNS